MTASTSSLLPLAERFRGRLSGRSAALGILGLSALLFFSGCNSADRRIRQNPELFYSLEPHQQELVRAGRVGLDFTPEMTSLAWGRPDYRETTRTEEGETQTWTWVNRRSVYDGRRFAGYTHDVYYDRRARQYRSFMRPVYVSVYRTVESEAGRVEFREGKAAVVTRVE
jgi:hypothetical protein